MRLVCLRWTRSWYAMNKDRFDRIGSENNTATWWMNVFRRTVCVYRIGDDKEIEEKKVEFPSCYHSQRTVKNGVDKSRGGAHCSSIKQASNQSTSLIDVVSNERLYILFIVCANQRLLCDNKKCRGTATDVLVFDTKTRMSSVWPRPCRELSLLRNWNTVIQKFKHFVWSVANDARRKIQQIRGNEMRKEAVNRTIT